ncbi:hypothetical protein FHG66_20920 [Rubellimicrobium rubrum]|uniref:Uncharacterized protein n=1 Tax=Rubellimicrobium rubrum TaxID=2585369 RepID=A0A5C4MH61_9RHOB|nr:hypothetical protein [Rubellimicrobium rubrum]TNC43649.1 hypothetical protein FHG66_20920 [Rubellimicrobium rubrum]
MSAAELLLTRAEAKLDKMGARLDAAEQSLQTGRTVILFLGGLATLGGLYLTYLGVLTAAQGDAIFNVRQEVFATQEVVQATTTNIETLQRAEAAFAGVRFGTFHGSSNEGPSTGTTPFPDPVVVRFDPPFPDGFEVMVELRDVRFTVGASGAETGINAGTDAIEIIDETPGSFTARVQAESALGQVFDPDRVEFSWIAFGQPPAAP